MKILKSIKWRLQIWYGLILVVVLAGFGITAYQLDRNRQFRQIDDELHRRVSVLASALHRPPPRRQNEEQPPFDRPSPEQMAEDGPPPFQRNRPLPEFHLPAEAVHLFDGNDIHNFFYAITLESIRGKTEIAHSANQPVLQEPEPIIREVHHVNNEAPIFPEQKNLQSQNSRKPISFWKHSGI